MKKPLLHELFVMELQDTYDAEQQIMAALPEMIETASNAALKKGFEQHLEQTEDHISRLEEIAEMIECDVEGEGCEGMEGLLSEGSEIMELDMEAPILDLALISAAQKVEHYEIAAYGTLITMAEEMGHTVEAKLLKSTLDEEKKTDDELTKVAEALYREIPE
ncbi:MAG: DUF892 family protein [bacterium]|nr:DUF892 family protein [bacterium]